uniref:Uncharacterized protein n=1 Tax=Molossus molossus TaxID=27622 RepID=A0A7J8I9L6_MOLMO|nr:hypothetical protein HJG59_010600 [Molossus molossus]
MKQRAEAGVCSAPATSSCPTVLGAPTGRDCSPAKGLPRGISVGLRPEVLLGCSTQCLWPPLSSPHFPPPPPRGKLNSTCGVFSPKSREGQGKARVGGSRVSSQLRGVGRKSEQEAAPGWFAPSEAQSCTGAGTH